MNSCVDKKALRFGEPIVSPPDSAIDPRLFTERDDRRPALISIPEARRQLGIGRSRVYELLRDGELLAVKLGARTLVVSDSVAAFIARLPPARFQASSVAKGWRP